MQVHTMVNIGQKYSQITFYSLLFLSILIFSRTILTTSSLVPGAEVIEMSCEFCIIYFQF